MTSNAEIADRLEELADLLEAQDVEYKPRAYRRAAETVRAQATPLADLVEREGPEPLQDLDQVGEAIAGKIAEYVETGEIEALEEERETLPVDMDALTRVEGVGPKTVGALYEALGIETLEDLEAAAEAGEIREVTGFGAKTEENIAENIPFAREATERQLLGDARPLAEGMIAYLEGVDAVERVAVAGSIRRWRPTIGDVDVLAATEEPARAVEAFTDWERADDVIEAGTSKASLRARDVRVDLRAVVPAEFGSALQYFTGSKDHNITLRTRAIDRGIKLNEYGAFDVSDVADVDAGQRVGERIGGETEAGMYEAVGLPWIPPELREDRGEIAAASEGALPDLLEPGDLRGDLHVHTDASDGAASLEEMADAAAKAGHDYLAIADHATGPGVVGGVGLSDEELREQMGAIADLDVVHEVTLLAGVEANVDADGDLSVGDDVLAELDLVVASPHSALDQDAETATDRLVRAIEHPQVDVLGHPSGRLLNRRPGLDLEVDRLAAAAAEQDVALEVNANPHRLDLWGEAVQTAIEAGATVAIDTDAHAPKELEHRRFGVHTARRGWATPADVLNAGDVEGVREHCGE